MELGGGLTYGRASRASASSCSWLSMNLRGQGQYSKANEAHKFSLLLPGRRTHSAAVCELCEA